MRLWPALAFIAAWESGAISRETMLDLFRRGEALPEGRTNEEEKLIAAARVVNGVQGSRDEVVGVGGTRLYPLSRTEPFTRCAPLIVANNSGYEAVKARAMVITNLEPYQVSSSHI